FLLDFLGRNSGQSARRGIRNAKKPDMRLAFQHLSPRCQYIRGHRRLKASGSAKLPSGHLARLVVTFQLEADLLAFDDRTHARTLDSRDVNEHIGAAIVRLDEAEAFGGVEPFNCASGHNEPFPSEIEPRSAIAQRFFRLLREGSSSRSALRSKNKYRPTKYRYPLLHGK